MLLQVKEQEQQKQTNNNKQSLGYMQETSDNRSTVVTLITVSMTNGMQEMVQGLLYIPFACNTLF